MTRSFDHRQILSMLAAAPRTLDGHRVNQAKIELLFKSAGSVENGSKAAGYICRTQL